MILLTINSETVQEQNIDEYRSACMDVYVRIANLDLVRRFPAPDGRVVCRKPIQDYCITAM